MGDSGQNGSIGIGESFAPVTYEEWLRVVERDLKGASFDKRLVTRTHEGVTLQPIYTAGDREQVGDTGGLPGQAPFTRGADAVRQGWQVRQEVADPDPAVANEGLRRDLAWDVPAVFVRCDTRTRLGRDGASASYLGALPGVSLPNAAAVRALLADVDLATTEVHWDAGANALAVAGLHLAAAEAAGVTPAALKAGFGMDPLGALAADGTLPGPLEAAWHEMAALVEWCAAESPDSKAIAVSTLPHEEAGASAAQQLAWALSTAVEYLRQLEAAGVEPAVAVGQIEFRFAIGRDIFVELAKLRAARRLWATVTAACGVEGGAPMRIHARTSVRTATQRDPWVNMLRGSAGTFAAAIGGADAITSAPFDEVVGAPDELSRRAAANTQTILQRESYLGRVTDPAGGSWALESLTDELAAAAWAEFQTTEGKGGMAAALTGGYVAEAIAPVAAIRKKGIARRKAAMTGVSEFPNLGEETIQRPAVAAPALPADGELPVLSAGAGAPLVTAAAEAAVGGTTLVAIGQALRGDRAVAEVTPLERVRDAAGYEALRAASDAQLAKSGARPRVFLANFGPIPQHKARAMFSQNLFEAGGIEAVGNDGFLDVEAVAAAFADSGAEGAVICSTDKAYAEAVPALAPLLKEQGAKFVAVAGRPGNNEDAWRSAGVDLFIFLGCDVLGTLSSLMESLLGDEEGE